MRYQVNHNKTLPTMLFDSRLDWKSKGVMATLYALEGLQEPQEVDQIIALVRSQGNTGATTVKNAFWQLIGFGYITKVPKK